MDAHLVGYGSSSDEEGKGKTQQSQDDPLEKDVRKCESSPVLGRGSEISVNSDSRSQDVRGVSEPSNEMDIFGKEAATNKDATSGKVNRSRSRSPVKRSPEKSTEKRQRTSLDKRSRSRSRSPSPSREKESRSTGVDEFGRRVQRHHSDRSKDEDRDDNRDRRRHSRDQRRSRSRSRERDRDRGFRRHDRRSRDDRFRNNDNRRRHSDSRRDRASPTRPRDRTSPARSRDRSPDRSRHRSPERGRDRTPELPRQTFLGGTEKRPIIPAKDKTIMSSEEIEKKLAARAEALKQVAQETASSLNLPSYLNPAVVNPQLYAKQQEKRKLLWSSKKTEQTPTNTKMWSGSRFAGDQGGEVQAKFRRLMGIKEGETGGTADTMGEEGTSTGEKILTDLEKEFERSRAFQLSRGAGGKSGIGLGYAPPSYN